MLTSNERCARRPIEDLAARMIGKPWKINTGGPKSFDCYGLVRYVYLHGISVELPAIQVFAETAFAYANGFRKHSPSVLASMFEPITEEEADDYDIALFGENWGWLHCGVLVRDRNRLGVLHSREGQGVVFEEFRRSMVYQQFVRCGIYRLVSA